MASKTSKRVLVPPGRFHLRTPLLPFDDYLAWGEGLSAAEAGKDARKEAVQRDTEILRARLRECFERTELRDALFVASPDTAKSLEYWLEDPDASRGQKVERTLVRYFSRMSGRATPFGLFSGLSTGSVGRGTQLELSARSSYRRHTRLDNDYLFALCEELVKDPEVRASLWLFPNSSLYEAAGRLRYAEARLSGRFRSYHLVAVEPSDYLRATLARAEGGATREMLAQGLIRDDPEIELEEAQGFIDELVDAQILSHELAPSVTGPEPIEWILSVLERAGASSAAAHARLEEARRAIAALDAEGLGAPPGRYEAIAENLRALPAKVELARLFQVDMVKPAPEASLGRNVVTEIEKGIDLLRRVTPKSEDEPLAEFRRRFAERYEAREVPLVLALDEEVGIGYQASGAPSAAALPLLEGLSFPGAAGTQKVSWGQREAHLLALLQEARGRDEREIVLDDRDLDELSAAESARLPDALACMAVLAAPSQDDLDRGTFRVLLEGAGGPSGARLLGRFCHASEELEAEVRAHLRAEEALDPEALFAEIAHLPEGRIGNILCRPVLRSHEIPFLGVSGAPRDRQIPIQDLMVRVEGDAVLLRSRSLDRVVIPRLTSAHNFSLRSLGIYRFLCALQSQHSGGVGFRWGPLADAPFLPRVRRGKLVLSRARWRLRKPDLEPLAEATKGRKRATTRDRLSDLRARGFAVVAALRERLRLPRHVVLADGDNELPIDLENVLSVDSFIQLVSSRSTAILYEDFPDPEELCARGPEGGFRHELALSFVRDRAPSERSLEQRPPAPMRTFLPDSEWMYVKLYTGTASADDVLRDAVAPVVREALSSGAAQKWFFLRYAEPDALLRVRFRGDPARLRREVLPSLREAAAPLVERGELWRIALDTYEREVERYGGPEGIDLAEELFWIDSEAVLDIVELLDGDEGGEARWRLTLRGADLLLRDLGFDLEGRYRVISAMRGGFGREFRVDTGFQKQLGEKFRKEREELATLLAPDPARDAEHDYAPGFEALSRRSERLKGVAELLWTRERRGELTQPVEALARSYIHMHANRLLRAPSRAQELVIYDLIKRYYESVRARGGAES